MAWDRLLKIAAWAFFCLMWIPLGMFIWSDSQGGMPEATDETLIILFVGMMFAFVILIFSSYFGPLLIGMWQGRQIRNTGTLVPATILRISDTGMYVNEQPVLEIVLSVRPPYEPVFEATVREIIPFSAIPQFQPGAKTQVYFLPGTTRVALPQ